MRGQTCTWSMFFWANDWLHWPHFIRLSSEPSARLNLLSSSQSSITTRSSFKTRGVTSRVRSAWVKVSPVGMVLWEVTGIETLWCQELRASLGEVGEGFSFVFTSSRDTGRGDLRGDVLVGVFEVTAGWVEAGAGYCVALIGRFVGCVWPWAAKTSCKSLVPRYKIGFVRPLNTRKRLSSKDS